MVEDSGESRDTSSGGDDISKVVERTPADDVEQRSEQRGRSLEAMCCSSPVT